jgi:hypothetical protein
MLALGNFSSFRDVIIDYSTIHVLLKDAITNTEASATGVEYLFVML